MSRLIYDIIIFFHSDILSYILRFPNCCFGLCRIHMRRMSF